MEILVGKTSGFCYGVKRAVEGATNEVINSSNTKEQVYCLGELVHNNQVIEKLKNLGINCIEKIEEANGTTIIRAHGVPKEIYEIAKEKNISLKDYTCPNVLKIHKIAQEYSENGYFIMLLGSKKHPENIGTLSYCKNYYVIESEKDVNDAIQTFKNSQIKKLLLISQTTFSVEKFNKITGLLKNEIESKMYNEIKSNEIKNNKINKNKINNNEINGNKINNNDEKNKKIEFVIKNTICKATELRQKEADEISKKVDMMIVIGGKDSSNTKKLYEIAKKNCSNSILIEQAKELKSLNNVKKVGIIAGASTPEESIKDTIALITLYKKTQ